MKYEKIAVLSTILIAFGSAHGGELEQQLLRCSGLGDASARLGCFDKLAKKTAPQEDPAQTGIVLPPAPKSDPAPAPALQASAAPAPALQASAAPAAETKTAAPAQAMSRMVQEWELDAPSRRGRFVFRPNRDTYLLLANLSSATNDVPFRAFTPAGINSKHVELTYQLSFKVKLMEGIGNSPVDLWAGYTQRSFWQAYNHTASSPFRETNYEPEMMASVPVNKELLGFNLRYAALGVVHQSNGQSGTLSRSWNRFYGEVGIEKDKFGLTGRLWKRLDNAKSENDNPDITDFMGHGELRGTYRDNGNEFSLSLRHNMDTHKGALQAGWAFPLVRNLNGYVQVFTGYGQSLIDYNYSQKSAGLGVLMDF